MTPNLNGMLSLLLLDFWPTGPAEQVDEGEHDRRLHPWGPPLTIAIAKVSSHGHVTKAQLNLSNQSKSSLLEQSASGPWSVTPSSGPQGLL